MKNKYKKLFAALNNTYGTDIQIKKKKTKPFSTRMRKLGRLVGASIFGFFTGVFIYGIIENIKL